MMPTDSSLAPSREIAEPSGAAYPPCPVCGRQTTRLFCFEKWGCRIERCDECGLGSCVPPADFDPTAIYDEAYFQGGRADGYADYAGSEAVLRAEFRRSLAALRKYAPASGRLLEIGCAHGFFLLEAAEHYQVQGVDVSEAAVERCRHRGLAATCARPGEDDFKVDEPQAAIVMLDCIEHLRRPDATLAWAWRALAPGGCLMISTGDWGSLLARWMGRRWRLMTPPQHLFYFTRASLIKLVERTGFRVVETSRPWKHVPLGLAAYQLGNRLGLRWKAFERLGGLGVPVNLGDALRIIARKEPASDVA